MLFYLFLTLVLLAVGGWLFMQMPVFGRNPTGARLARIEQSPQYRDGSFQNLHPTDVQREGTSYWEMTMEFLRQKPDVQPSGRVPSVRTNLTQLSGSAPQLVWFGHSSYLIRSQDFTMLVDPVLSGYASPISLFGKAFDGANDYQPADFPVIDALLLTHDHYDHLDYATIVQMIPKTKHFYVSLGVGEHLERWGVAADRITELEWGQYQAIADSIGLRATPARHFTGRGFVRGKTLWSSFVLDLHGYRLFLGGDSGYDTHFKQIGDQYGPFDLAILENGQYGKDWPLIHTFPEETAQAAQDLKAKVLLPVHWGKFVLANHGWTEPIERLLKASEGRSYTLTTPRIGEVLTLGAAYPQQTWWRP